MYREITIIKNEYSKIYNRDFNSKMKSISDEIFQTEQIFPAGYMPIGTYESTQTKFSANRSTDQNITTSVSSDKFDSSWDKLSEYERIIASHLLYGYYNTYIFSGGMGSGKTSTATHVLEFIREKYTTPKSAFIKIVFDFNMGVLNESENNGCEIINRFTQELYNKLKVAIYNHVKNNQHDMVRKFSTFIESKDYEDYSEFFDLGTVVNNLSWLDLSNQKRATAFIAFIERNDEKISKIEMLMKFLRFLKSDLSENEFIILFYDNIDVLEPIVQNKIFHDYILPLNTIAKTKCLISLRRTTFLRAFDYRDTRFAHSFGFIHHHGHQVSEVILQRLTFWKDNIETSKLFYNIDIKWREAVRNRIIFLHHEFSNHKHQYSLKSFINSLSGNSMRLGLYISHRLLINNIIKYDDNPTQRDRYKKALIVSLEDNLLLSDYDEIINLFTVKDNFSLLPIRLLMFISDFNKSEGKMEIRDILNDKYFNGFWSEETILDTIKNLMYSRRPLLWMDKINTSLNLDLESFLFITEIGDGYINHLVEDLTYVQECFMVAKWNSDNIPLSVDFQNEYERLSTVIKCLRVAFDEDVDHSQEFAGKNLSRPLITLGIIAKILNTIVGLNFSSGLKQITEHVEDLLTYILNSKGVASLELTGILEKIKLFKENTRK